MHARRYARGRARRVGETSAGSSSAHRGFVAEEELEAALRERGDRLAHLEVVLSDDLDASTRESWQRVALCKDQPLNCVGGHERLAQALRGEGCGRMGSGGEGEWW